MNYTNGPINFKLSLGLSDFVGYCFEEGECYFIYIDYKYIFVDGLNYVDVLNGIWLLLDNFVLLFLDD